MNQVGYDIPANMTCQSCGKKLTKTDPKRFHLGQFTCGDCLYWISLGKTPPNSLTNNQ